MNAITARPCFAGVEAGGTKFVGVVGSAADALGEPFRVETGDPARTLDLVAEAIRARAPRVDGVGLGAFGPIGVDAASPLFGRMLETPKRAWRGYDVVGHLRRALGVPIRLETDVVAAAVAEYRLGAGRGRKSIVYITVGTGIGGGALLDGRPVQGAYHAEMGHVPVARAPKDTYAGACPTHGGDCLEGLASGPAMQARWGAGAASLPPEHPAWELEAYYLSQAICGIALTIAPDVVIVGGGVPHQAGLFPRMRDGVHARLNGYVHRLRERADLDAWLVPPALGDRAGSTGAWLLAAGGE